MLPAERLERLHLTLGRKQRLPSDADAAGAPSELRAGRQCREKVLERFDRPEPAVPDDEEKLGFGWIENGNELELVDGRRFLRPRRGRTQDSQGREEREEEAPVEMDTASGNRVPRVRSTLPSYREPGCSYRPMTFPAGSRNRAVTSCASTPIGWTTSPPCARMASRVAATLLTMT